MPGVYSKGELEIVGFSVGVVERDDVIDGSTIAEGDVLVGLASSGFHSNGYSLVRSVVEDGIRAGQARPLRSAAPSCARAWRAPCSPRPAST